MNTSLQQKLRPLHLKHREQHYIFVFKTIFLRSNRFQIVTNVIVSTTARKMQNSCIVSG